MGGFSTHGGATGLRLSCGREKATAKQNPLSSILYWAPRLLGILFSLFVSIFALDVFGQGYGFWEPLLPCLCISSRSTSG
jgi:hypothetical protein